MKIIRFIDENNQTHLGQDYDGTHATLLDNNPQPTPPTHLTNQRIAVQQLLSPIVPRAILCIGKNYADHIKESTEILSQAPTLPELPVLFMKNPAAFHHPNQPIILPACCMDPPEVDYEGELAFVLNRDAKNVTEKNALDYVLGYTIANDISARTWQKKRSGGQWIRGKSFDTFCPLGPVLVTPDEIPDPQNLKIQTRVNGQVRQDGHTSDMIFSIPFLISELSRDTTLLAGTVILTGTPAGVGAAMNPPSFLMPGDQLEVEIQNIGILSNSVTTS